MPHRSILHVDMDAFFASVEQLDDPGLRGRPVLVGGSGSRGVVAAASYEARRFGCASAMPMAIARRRCPRAVIVKPRGRRYAEVSKQVFEIFHRFTPLVEGLSIDEAFLDVTGSRRLFGDAPTIGRRIKQAIRDEIGLTASIGVATNKFLAKLGSGLEKPDALTVIDPEWIERALPKLPIGCMWGVGPAAERRLRGRGVCTFGDLAELPQTALRQLAGSDGERLQRLARGEDDRPVVPEHDPRSISHEQTFGTDLEPPDAVRRVLLGQVEQVAERLRRQGLCGRTVTVKIRFGDFQTITRSASLAEPTDRTDLIWAAARELFDRWAEAGFTPVRLIGAGVSRLGTGEAQLGLFSRATDDRRRRLDAITDQIHERFGREAIRRGGGWPGGR